MNLIIDEEDVWFKIDLKKDDFYRINALNKKYRKENNKYIRVRKCKKCKIIIDFIKCRPLCIHCNIKENG
jgi:hypothetical protein